MHEHSSSSEPPFYTIGRVDRVVEYSDSSVSAHLATADGLLIGAVLPGPITLRLVASVNSEESDASDSRHPVLSERIDILHEFTDQAADASRAARGSGLSSPPALDTTIPSGSSSGTGAI